MRLKIKTIFIRIFCTTGLGHFSNRKIHKIVSNSLSYHFTVSENVVKEFKLKEFVKVCPSAQMVNYNAAN